VARTPECLPFSIIKSRVFSFNLLVESSRKLYALTSINVTKSVAVLLVFMGYASCNFSIQINSEALRTNFILFEFYDLFLPIFQIDYADFKFFS